MAVANSVALLPCVDMKTGTLLSPVHPLSPGFSAFLTFVRCLRVLFFHRPEARVLRMCLGHIPGLHYLCVGSPLGGLLIELTASIL